MCAQRLSGADRWTLAQLPLRQLTACPSTTQALAAGVAVRSQATALADRTYQTQDQGDPAAASPGAPEAASQPHAASHPVPPEAPTTRQAQPGAAPAAVDTAPAGTDLGSGAAASAEGDAAAEFERDLLAAEAAANAAAPQQVTGEGEEGGGGAGWGRSAEEDSSAAELAGDEQQQQPLAGSEGPDACLPDRRASADAGGMRAAHTRSSLSFGQDDDAGGDSLVGSARGGTARDEPRSGSGSPPGGEAGTDHVSTAAPVGGFPSRQMRGAPNVFCATLACCATSVRLRTRPSAPRSA